MAKSKNLKDKGILETLSNELIRFNNLVKGHKKLLKAIASI